MGRGDVKWASVGKCRVVWLFATLCVWMVSVACESSKSSDHRPGTGGSPGGGAPADAGEGGEATSGSAGKSGTGGAGAVDGEGGESGMAGAGGTETPPPSLPQCTGALDSTVATRFYDAARCLFEGRDPPQVGVAPRVIDPERVAVLRGRVLDGAGEPISGVVVRVAKHPEFGETRTRADGYFDAAVNGGGILTVRYEKDGYLPVRRRIQSEWRNFAHLPDVVLTEESGDTETMIFEPNAPSVIEGGYSSDDSGDRHELLFAGAGTRADLVFEDGLASLWMP